MWSKKRFNANNILAVAALSSAFMLSSCQVLVRQIDNNIPAHLENKQYVTYKEGGKIKETILPRGEGYVYNNSVKKSNGIAGLIRLGRFDTRIGQTEWSTDVSPIIDMKRKNGISLYTVQFNAALVAKTDLGTTANFWLQDLVSIGSKNEKVYIAPGSELFQYNSSQTDPMKITYTIKGNGKIASMPNYDANSYIYNDFKDASGPYASLVLQLRLTEKIDMGELQINFYFNGKRFDKVTIGNKGSFLSAKFDASKRTPIEFGIVGFRNGEAAIFTKQYQRTELEIKQLSGNKWTPLDISTNGKNICAETSNLRYIIRNGHTAEAMLRPQK
jgi:hypothetical protein